MASIGVGLTAQLGAGFWARALFMLLAFVLPLMCASRRDLVDALFSRGFSANVLGSGGACVMHMYNQCGYSQQKYGYAHKCESVFFVDLSLDQEVTDKGDVGDT
ncbi:MAG: hypothetical protein ACOYNB_03580 [Aquabacterium sp.]|uniref:hypothetical protein n=1 Tax=Aquabacterium sp. TaxID=1872578 RepID=UPI003BDE185B